MRMANPRDTESTFGKMEQFLRAIFWKDSEAGKGSGFGTKRVKAIPTKVNI